MKKIMSFAAALVAILSAVSCHQENLLSEKSEDQEVEVVFSISTEDALGTTAIGEALMHKELHFGVYKHMEGEESVYLPDVHYVINHFGNVFVALKGFFCFCVISKFLIS